MSTEQGATVLRQAPASNLKESLSPEEQLLTKELLGHGARKGMRISMTDFPTTLLVGRMADMMRRDALGVWFQENRAPVVAGTVLSAIAVIIAARPRWRNEWLALGLSLVIMAPAAFYLPFLVLRLHDLYRTAHQKLDADVVRRAGILLAWVLPSAAGITVGCVELGVTFGWPVLAVTAIMTSLDVWFLHFMRTPTADGRLLLDEIEGFRLFLREVDRLSMAQSEAPKNHPGLYEKYLPYAVALEVEQPWSDRFVALASTFPHDEGIKKSQSFYLGMWNGEPIEIIYSPKLR